MISCQTYRASLSAGTQDAALLEHLRRCDACLDFSVAVDPDNFFSFPQSIPPAQD